MTVSNPIHFGTALSVSADRMEPWTARWRPGLSKASRLASAMAISLVLVVAAGCAGSNSSPTPSGNQAPVAGGGNAGGGNNGGGAQGPAASPTPNAHGPYVVKQTESLGGETISGDVCSTLAAFNVDAATSRVKWTFKFVPTTTDGGTWKYDYVIAGAGESHDASGNFTLGPAGSDGTLPLSMTGSDHVVFKGFDGQMPVKYAFDLAPSTNTSCPAT